MDNVFDELTRVFDELIDWPKRLASEAPFHRGLFDRVGLRRLVDVACGTGRHAAMFHSWGLQVQAAHLAGLGDPGPDPLAEDLAIELREDRHHAGHGTARRGSQIQRCDAGVRIARVV